MPDDSLPLSPAGDEKPSTGSTPPPSAVGGPTSGDITWAGNRSLDSRWWWSAALMIVVGVVVIGYQSGPIRSGEAIVLTWVMVAVGAAVAVAGAISLKRAYVEHRASTAGPSDEPSAGPPA